MQERLQQGTNPYHPLRAVKPRRFDTTFPSEKDIKNYLAKACIFKTLPKTTDFRRFHTERNCCRRQFQI